MSNKGLKDRIEHTFSIGSRSFLLPGGVPVAILNPALVSLQRSLDNLEEVQVSRSDVERAAKYLRCAVTFHEGKARRQNAVKELVDVVKVQHQADLSTLLYH